ncbi:hypothetical protein [Vibrio breoganii]|uniref:hypothetical protein n=1 Tax=Vibrio breoganii TaxID=553239 RepID=UPI000C84D84E|nr:hypothetical protein [Vibrio breoganii]PMG90890.1 hypothetical protein BCU79_17530 [Vibrio breoganii]PMJ48010.1 hypothetical protein BCU21_04855 [Vibrio breoganii]PMK62367.1 hypothetical protein BCT97_18850 [Vibrio breoganii]PMM89738.1 hypothetical protein BCT44_16635 [Vibrio breoganii]PMO23082.1 hypothetical protein BCT14_18475 [Vibrio breoganii]
MKILYFDPHALLYSSAYLSKNDDIRGSYEAQLSYVDRDTFMTNVEPDRKGIRKLANAAIDAHLLLYPTGDRYTRELLIKHKLLKESELAPYVDLALRVRLDDRDPLRLMLVHAGALNAEWYVCGDIATDERLKSFPNRYFLTQFGEGVSEELISMIAAIE